MAEFKAKVAHQLKPIRGCEGPSNFLFFDTEAWPYSCSEAPDRIRFRFRLGSAFACRWSLRGRDREKWCHFTDPACFWEFLESRLDKRRPLWVYAHNLAFDFRLVKGFTWLTYQDPRRWKLVLADPPVIMRGRVKDCTVYLVDSYNYFRCSLEEIGAAHGYPKLPMPPFTASEGCWLTYCRRDVEILATAILELRSWLQENDLGPWGVTAAQIAIRSFRYRFMTDPLMVHADPQVAQLERRSYYGGRLECYYLGPARGEFHHLDINSLYPWCMSTQPTPQCLVSVIHGCRPDELERVTRTRGACAQVWIDTAHTPWPKRLGRLPLWLTGRFRTWLCGQELVDALRFGYVARVEVASTYEVGCPFLEYVATYAHLRAGYRREGKPALEALAKLLLNSLSGKWAQKSPRWVERSWIRPPTLWANWAYRDIVAQTNVELRSIAGCVQERMQDGEWFDSFPAISGFICASGRCHMDRLKVLAGERHYYYEDTDSLMVDALGFDQLLLHHQAHQERLGKLKLLDSAPNLAIHGPKWYLFGERGTCGRIRKGAEEIGPHLYRQWNWTRAGDALVDCDRASCSINATIKRLSTCYTKGVVGEDGWTRPYDYDEVREQFPEHDPDIV